MEVFRDDPLTSIPHISLLSHQSQTPASFYSSRPVLYRICTNIRLVALRQELLSSPALSHLIDDPVANGATTNGSNTNGLTNNGSTTNGSTTNGATTIDEITNGHVQEHQDEEVFSNIDVFVYSHNFLIYHTTKQIGVSIPYPNISLHAIQRIRIPSSPPGPEVEGVLMQIDTSDGFDDHEPDATISMTIIPCTDPISPSTLAELIEMESPETRFIDGVMQDGSPATEIMDDFAHEDSPPPESLVEGLYNAITTCTNLHPDPQPHPADMEADIRNGHYEPATYTFSNYGMPPPMPGSGGWITAENVNDFFDEEGNPRAGGLGPGAGTVRQREDERDEGVDAGMRDDMGGEEEEVKYRRIE